MLDQEPEQFGEIRRFVLAQEPAHPGEDPEHGPRPARPEPRARARPPPEGESADQQHRKQCPPVHRRLAQPPELRKRRGNRDPKRLESTQESRHDVHDQQYEQSIGQHQDHERITECQPDRAARIEVGPHEGGQALQRRGQPAGPQPRLDHRPVDARQPVPLRRRSARTSSLPRSSAPPSALHRPAEPSAELGAHLGQPTLQRQARPHQRGDLIIDATRSSSGQRP